MMTLDEAIIHAENVAESADCEECRQEHLQLADWLKELKTVRAERDAAIKDIKRDCSTCKYKSNPSSEFQCVDCLHHFGDLDRWEWEGVQNEN